MKKEWMDLLVKSFDEQLTTQESTILAEALAQSAELRAEKVALLKMRDLFANFSVEGDEQFVNNVMEAITSVEIIAKRKIIHYLSQIYPKAIAACLFILMSFITYIYLSTGNLDTETLIGINELSPDEAYSFLMEE